jgi:signal transduction histidine kinase/ActR/RegA family two-component response regulator
LQERHLRAVYEAWHVLSPLHAIAGVFLVITLRDKVSSAALTVGMTMLATCLVVLGLIAAGLKNGRLNAVSRSLIDGMVVGASSALGVTWAAAFILFFHDLETAYKVVMTVVILVVATPTALFAVPNMVLVYAFLAPVLVAASVAWLMHGADIGLSMGALLVAALCLHLYLGRRQHLQYVWRQEALARAEMLTNELMKKNDLLEDANKNKLRMLAAASHDLRQPAHALGMLLERLRSTPYAADTPEQIEQIARVSRSLSTSLELLLDFSKLEAGTVQPRKAAVSVAELFDQLRAEFEQLARAKKLRLEIESTSAHVFTDAVLLQVILSNLLTNAIRYTSAGKVMLCARVGEDGGRCLITVTDTGRGIDEDSLHRIFDEYVQIGPHETRTEGLGLGLAIVRKTAQLLGHTVSVASQPGSGSTFGIEMDICAPAHDKLESPGTGAVSWRALMGKRIVLIDNDPVVLSSMQSMVQSWGCIVICATSYDELAHKLRSYDLGVDAIVADYRLGTVMNGLDAIELCRSRIAQLTPAILLTGDVNIRFGAESSAVELMHKPVQPAKLRVLLARLCRASVELEPQ